MKLAFVTPRYGAEIPSGAEHACRLLAEQVCERHDVDVLTTCAWNPETWKNELGEGSDRVRGVMVRRFAVTQPYERNTHQQLTERLLAGTRSRDEELEWVRRLGPWSPGLLDYLKRQHRAYDVIVFFSLWHPTTVHGLPVAPDRSVLFPYLQLRRPLRFGLWTDVASSARAIGYVATCERRLLHQYVRVMPPHEEHVGIGIDSLPQQTYPRHQQDPADTIAAEDEQGEAVHEAPDVAYLDRRGVPFRRRHRLYGRLAVCCARIEADNGSEEMLEYFDAYASTNGGGAERTHALDGDPLTLVLTGVKMMKVPEESYVRLAGVLPDRERMMAYEAADIAIAPAPDDLLAEAVLESFAVGTPVIASARNPAAVDHCRRANAGLYYGNKEEFVEAMRLVTGNDRLRLRLGENGRNYVKQNYRWDAVLGRFERLISKVRGR